MLLFAAQGTFLDLVSAWVADKTFPKWEYGAFTESVWLVQGGVVQMFQNGPVGRLVPHSKARVCMYLRSLGWMSNVQLRHGWKASR